MQHYRSDKFNGLGFGSDANMEVIDSLYGAIDGWRSSICGLFPDVVAADRA